MPLVGIGGITPERVGMVLSAGAKGVAVMRGVWNAENPGEAVQVYLSELKGG
jgi:thiazole tautomerase (transcriptional regulator TenI)